MSVLNLRDFRQRTKGFAQACHFNMTILDFKNLSFPPSNQDGIQLIDKLHLFVSATSLPSKTIEAQRINVHYGHPGIHIASNVNYSPWTVTFYSDERLLIRRLFLAWQETILNSSVHSYTTPYRYKSQQASLTMLNGRNGVVQSYNFKGLFPTEVGSASLQQQDAGILTFDVTLQYDYFVLDSLEGIGLSAALERNSMANMTSQALRKKRESDRQAQNIRLLQAKDNSGSGTLRGTGSPTSGVFEAPPLL
jgi:hypothetical protein